MNQQWRILHLTDLHIKAPEQPGEHLRQSYFKGYIDRLATIVRKMCPGKYDAIIVTGDFVDEGKTKNFSHAAKVLKHVAKQFSVPLDRCLVCPGNHDIDRRLDKKKRLKGARDPFRKFSVQFGKGNVKGRLPRATLYYLPNRIACLMLDATWGSNGRNSPGPIARGDIDQIVSKFVEKLPRNELLVVGSHYPVCSFPDMMDAMEIPNWEAHHLWKTGAILKERIVGARGDAPTLWLCGDVHGTGNLLENRLFLLAGGRLGVRTCKGDSSVPRVAQVVRMSSDGKRPDLLIASHPMPGHVQQADYGDWTAKWAKVHFHATYLPDSSEIGVPAVTSLAKPTKSTRKTAPLKRANGVVELLDPKLQERLLLAIKRDSLYSLGRFKTSPSQVSLAWVSIGPLLNQVGILPGLLHSMLAWLKGKLGLKRDAQIQDAVLLGIDCWGAILASQLSVLTGVPNFCIAARTRGAHFVPQEDVSTTVLQAIRKSRVVVLISDVVATGESIAYLHNKIRKELSTTEYRRLKWFCLSVLSDRQQRRTVDCSFLLAHGTACAELRMPVVSASALPDEAVLRPKLSFV